ncbi:MAG: thiol reductant ABC exporter subunit CydD [Chloroflexota bacterium]
MPLFVYRPLMHKRLLALTRNAYSPLIATILFGLLAGWLTIGQAATLSQVVDRVFLGGEILGDLSIPFSVLLIIILARSALAWLIEVSATKVAVRIKNDLRAQLYAKILNMGPRFSQGQRTGELTATVVEGVEALDAYFSQYLPQLVIAALVPVSILLFVLPLDLLSGLVLLFTAPLIPLFMYLIGKAGEALTNRQWDTLSRLSAHFLDSLQGLVTLKHLGRSREQARTIADAIDRFRDVTLGVLRGTFLSALVLELVTTLSTAVVAVEVGLRLLYGYLPFQDAFFLLILAPEFYLPLRMLGLRFHAGMAGVAAARSIFALLDEPVQPHSEGGNLPAGTTRTVSELNLKKVSFAYASDLPPVLERVSFSVRNGQHVAIVGVTGAGKSTLAAILLGFLTPSGGRVEVDGCPLDEIPIDDWRSRIAWVPQQPYLFHDTFAANIRLARPDAGDQEVENAARAANLHDFISSLPDGYATLIGEDASRLSAGQAQRLALARAFLKDAPILLLDEPTSSLDPHQEALLQQSIRRLTTGRMVVTIAHRLNTVTQADMIVVLDDGRVVETGTHDQLLARRGAYANLVNPSVFRTYPDSDDNLMPIVIRTDIELTGQEAYPESGNISGVGLPIFIRLAGFLKGSWSRVALSIILGVLTITSNVALMGVSAYLISAAALHPSIAALQVAIVGVRFFGISRGVFRYLERLITHDVTFRLLAALRTWFYRALEPLAPARLMHYRAGDLLNRIVADIDALELFYVRLVSPPFVTIIVTAGMTCFLAGFQFAMSAIYIVTIGLLAIGLPLAVQRLSHRPADRLARERAELRSHLVDGIQGLADILSFGRGPDKLALVRAAGSRLGKAQQQMAWINGFQSGMSLLLTNLGAGLVLVIAILLVRSEVVAGVMLPVIVLATLASFEAVTLLPVAAQAATTVFGSAQRLFALVDTHPEVVDPPKSLLVHPPVSILMKDLQFSYDSGKSYALEGVSLDLPAGKRLAVVGPSGAGKSTLGNILLRFWDSYQGECLLNGHDLRQYSQEQVRRQVSVVTQRTYFFNQTIRQNLLLARPDAHQADLEQAARQAEIHAFIVGLPQGYDTEIGERGTRLSGGEKQRLAIARALLKAAPVLILDEPTANLDPFTERQIIELLFKLTSGRSLLLITHRLVGLEQMDEILVLDRGRVVERGTHLHLLGLDGLYSRMWGLQNRLFVT